MALANISLSDTFTTWVGRFNQLLTIGNLLTYGQANSTGTLTITNPSYLNGNVSLNVSNGVIQVQGNNFTSNTTYFVSNSSTLTVSGTGRLGTTIYFNIGQLSNNPLDANTANIATANAVNQAYGHANDAFNYVNTSITGIGAASNGWANTVVAGANSWTNAVFGYSNTYTQTVGAASNGWANTVVAGANAWVNTSVTSAGIGANTWANTKLSNTSGITFAGSFYIPSGSNLGIGTTSPAANLDVVGSVSLAKANVLSQTLTDGATISWNTSLGQIATVTLGGSRTMAAPTNLKVGTYILSVIQGGSGSYTLTWNGVFKWPAGVAPTLTTTVGARDVMSFFSDGTNLYGTYINNVS
jgi:hypothetical protein